MHIQTFNPLSAGLYPKLIVDYLQGLPSLSSFYKYTPDENGLVNTLKNRVFSLEKRKALQDALLSQHGNMTLPEAVTQNILSLASPESFTITTGHQLSLLTGPLYTLYKVMNTIALCKKMALRFPDKKFVPVFWMASEDHDLEEIQRVKYFNTEVSWNTTQTGATGRMNTEGMADMIAQAEAMFLQDAAAKKYIDIFKRAYSSNTLAEATRDIFYTLFGKEGLVIIDADDIHLKKLFAAYIKKDVLHEENHPLLLAQTEELQVQYKTQVHPREINFFYLRLGKRERIIRNGDIYTLAGAEEAAPVWSTAELEQEIENHPENFSPNVCMRPLYQEVILPNLAYIGGPGEISYWLQLSSMFAHHHIDFPVLWVRNSVFVIGEGAKGRMAKADISIENFLLSEEELKKDYLNKYAEIQGLAEEKMILENYANELKKKVGLYDQSLVAQADGAFNKFMDQINGLEKKLEKSQQLKHEAALNRIAKVKAELFPDGGPQERSVNILSVAASFDLVSLLQAMIDSDSKGFIMTA